MTAVEPLLTVERLSVKYGQAQALADVSITVPEGTALAVLGSNGAGKSTLARTISGLVPSHDGSVTFAGTAITDAPPYRIRRLGLVHLPEGRCVFPGLSVIDNLRMAVKPTPRGERAAAVERAMSLFPILGERTSQLAGSLSGGEQQMLSLARGLAVQPRLLIADEMSLGLAPRLVEAVFEGLERARAMGVTVILIEQFVHRALAFADHCCILRRGAVAWHGAASEAATEVVDSYLGAS